MAEDKELYLGYATDKAMTPFLKEFMKRLDDGKLSKSVCTSCNTEYLPPRQHCQKCLSLCELADFDEREAQLYSYSVVEMAPAALSSKQPYVVAVGEFPSGLRLTAHITNLMSMPKVGMPMKIDFENVTDKLITYKWLV